MEIICLEEPAFFSLIDKVLERVKSTQNIKEDKWISGVEAMEKL